MKDTRCTKGYLYPNTEFIYPFIYLFSILRPIFPSGVQGAPQWPAQGDQDINYQMWAKHVDCLSPVQHTAHTKRKLSNELCFVHFFVINQQNLFMRLHWVQLFPNIWNIVRVLEHPSNFTNQPKSGLENKLFDQHQHYKSNSTFAIFLQFYLQGMCIRRNQAQQSVQ